ncbi:hypothetical protein EMCRGX_G033387 [Ephydatia muelleri]|eukprot:Em0022g839a
MSPWLLSGILLYLLLQVHVEAQHSPDKTLYLLSFLTYPDSATNLSVSQGSRYAIDLINSESIIPGYKLDLIEASDDCDISWNGIANLVRNLYYSDKQVIAVVGPECSNVAKVFGSLLGLSQISLINIHLATSYALSNRTLYPYSFGINTPKYLSVAAIAALIDHNGWSRIGILYDPSVPEYVDSYGTFLNAMKDYTVELAFTSYVSLTYFPLAGLKATYVRVIVSFLGQELQKKVLCLAYHMNMTYPRYQWILVDPSTANDPLGNVSIKYTNTEYTCDKDQLASALNRSVSAAIDKLSPLDTITLVPGISNYDPFENCSAAIVECVLTFDATLALALALNRSIRPLMERNLSLSDYTAGEHSIASIIQQEIMNLSFAGMAGTIVQFDPNTGYPSAVITSLLQYSEEFGINSTFATMLNGTLHFKDVAFAFVSTDFDRIHRTTPIPLATVVVAIGVVVPLVVLVGIHVLNTVYWKVPSIKASSSNLNHFAYVGCYFILLAEVAYTSGELASFNIQAKTVLCNVFPWCLILGLTLVLSTVCVKTCRLYFIFTASIKGANRRLVVKLKDNLLASIIVGLVLASAVLLTAWTWSHPLVRQATNRTVPSGETFVILLEDYCDTENQAYWFAAAIIFEATLLASCVLLAFLNRNVIMKDFQTHSVILLAYLLTLTGIVGAATYFITSSIGALNISLSYGIQCLVLSLIVYLCIFLLFLPPIWPVLKRMPALKSGVNQKNPPERIMRQNTVMSRI